MRWKTQRPPADDEPQYLPSTTRAVAWGALFFSVLAFLISTATFLLTFRDGLLAQNAVLLLRESRKTIDHIRQTSAEESAQADPQRIKVREQLDRYVKMIDEGDTRARFYLESLRGDIDKLRQTTGSDGVQWLKEASETIDSARRQISENAPEAARRLRELADKLSPPPATAPAQTDEQP